MRVKPSQDWGYDSNSQTSFETKIQFSFPGKESAAGPLELSFSAGDFVAIKGETGIGKTTLLRSIGGLIKSDCKLTVDGVEISHKKSWRPTAALVSQNPFLSGNTLIEMVTGEEVETGVDIDLYQESLRVSCLTYWLQKRTNEISNENISGGERKQIALARAIYLKPEILLLDEVTAGMDRDLAEKILRNLLDSPKFKLVLLATHDSIMESEFSQIIYL
jgi:ABC-type transport system involved in cytochrome bd biosynthesis fused ATPase/permease subunit